MLPKGNYNQAGWDIGGAHLKLAFVESDSLVTRQWDCPLWKGLQELEKMLNVAINEVPNTIVTHNVTMTGELVDIFSSHEEGVEKIANTFIKYIDNNVSFYSSHGLLKYDEMLGSKSEVASANWIASAKLAAQNVKDAVFVDMGSTTTDILHIENNKLVLNGKTDFDRLVSGELVYTGVVRSCVNTVCNSIPFGNATVPLMAEYFSNTADVYRILGWLPDHADYGSTMDGKPKDKHSSIVRLARMIGKDYNDSEEKQWLLVCEYIAEQQIQKIEAKVLSLLESNSHIKSIVGAGVGKFLIEKVAKRLHLEYFDFAQSVIPKNIKYNDMVSDCAPAVALALASSKMD